MSSLQVALLQVCASEDSMEANIAKGEAFCRQARRMGADVALFPEMWNTGYTFFDPNQPQGRQDWLEKTVDTNHYFIQHFQQLARTLYMVIGLTYLEKWQDAPRNTLSLIDRNGKLALTYAKVHTCDFDLEAELTPGDQFPVCELDTSVGSVRTGTMICFDREFPESARSLMLNGAEIILVPNACEMEINRISQLRARAYENMTGIALANYPRPQQNAHNFAMAKSPRPQHNSSLANAPCPQYNGHSIAFDGIAFDEHGSRDMLLVEAGEQEGIYLARFDLEQLRAYRAREVWGNAYRKPGCYGALTSTQVEPPFQRQGARR